MEIPKKILYTGLVVLLLLSAIATTLYTLGYHNFNSLTVSNLFFKGRIALIPLGIEEGTTEGWLKSPYEVRLIKSQIEEIYGFEVDVLTWQEMPESAYLSLIESYNAMLVLDYLTAVKPERYDKVIGLTNSNIVANFDGLYRDVIGLSYRGGVASVISTLTIRTHKFSDGHYYRRLTKASLHELGHTLGLPHCNNTSYCFMKEAREQVKTVDSENIILCDNCKKSIAFTQN